jgi:GNAT superfamily N-acetyltransferase
MSITVRTATAEDRASILAMLREFMDYLNAIEASEEDVDLDTLVDQGFGPDPVCQTLIAERDGVPVGYVGFHPGVWEVHRAIYVISLFVRTEARGTGAGRALMEAVKSIARAQRARRVVWEVWRKNPSAIDFYRGIGAEAYDDNLRMSLVVD